MTGEAVRVRDKKREKKDSTSSEGLKKGRVFNTEREIPKGRGPAVEENETTEGIRKRQPLTGELLLAMGVSFADEVDGRGGIEKRKGLRLPRQREAEADNVWHYKHKGREREKAFADFTLTFD